MQATMIPEKAISINACDTKIFEDTRPQFRPFQVKQWDYYFNKARIFREQHGHCMISKKTNASPELAVWAKRQRYLYKQYLTFLKCNKDPSKHQCQMTPERVAVLNGIGFCWDTHELIWEERFQELKEFGRVYGHLNIRSGPRGLPHLANWVKAQRRQYKLWIIKKRTSMTRDRIRRLEDLGFRWTSEKSLNSLINLRTTPFEKNQYLTISTNSVNLRNS